MIKQRHMDSRHDASDPAAYSAGVVSGALLQGMIVTQHLHTITMATTANAAIKKRPPSETASVVLDLQPMA